MKKLYKSKKHKKFNKKHSKKLFTRKLRSKRLRKYRNRNLNYLPKEIKQKRIKEKKLSVEYFVLYAPQIFSFIRNSDEVIVFIDKLTELFNERKKVFVKLEDVEKIDYDAIVVLLSIMIQFKANKIKFNGDYPKNLEAYQIVKKSGFIENLFEKFTDEDRYDVKTKHDGIHTHAWKDVDSILAGNIIKEASLTIWNEERRCQGIQRTLLELMQNTNNHAKLESEGEKHWWLSTNHLKEEQKVCFSFVDYGVGVFKSLENKSKDNKFFNWKEKLLKVFTFQDNSDVFKLILNGNLHQTVTNEHFRGKGLPGIKEALDRNQLSNLYIITNDVYADIVNNKYKILKKPFAGTFVYWELNKDNRSCICQKS